MKQPKKLITMIIAMVTVMFIVQACKKNSSKPDYNSDKSKLTAELDSANSLYATATEGKQAGDYTVGSKATLLTSINLAKGVQSGSFTQQEVNNATANLVRAINTFKGTLIQQVSVANLVAYWKFDGDATDASGNNHNGMLKTGWVGTSTTDYKDGNTLPVATTDRYGAAGKAFAFNNGAYVEVPYDATLRPTSFTISVWINPQASSNGNYIFSLNRWLGYKFQLQGSNLPFLTVFTNTGDFDKDDGGTPVALGKWSQVMVTLDSGTENFYINGKLVGTQTISGTPTTLTSPPNVSIGNELPKSAYNFTDSSSPYAFYGANFFIGSIDDLRLYNKALSAAEVNSLYAQEQP